MLNDSRILEKSFSRRTLVKGAGAAGLGLTLGSGALGSGLSLGSGMLGKGTLLRQAGVLHAVAAGDESVQDIINIAITAEALAVTLLGGAIASAEGGMYDQPLPDVVIAVLKAARAEEQYHYDYLEAAGATPLTETFYVPDTALLTSTETLFGTIVALETAFVAAYMAAARRFAVLGQTELVKVAFEVAGVEAEHRVLANYVLGTRPANDFAFYPNLFDSVGAAAQALTDLGFIGGPGTEVSYPGPGDIDASMVTNTEPTGPDVSCIVPDVSSGGTVLIAPLTGGAEPSGGDSDGFGFAKVVVNPAASQICWRLSVANIAPATASHIHAGGIGTDGPVVVPLAAPAADGLGEGCVVVDPALAQDIIDNPGNYYVNVHNDNYQAGAVRGQLQRL